MHYLILTFSIINFLLGLIILVETKRDNKSITFLIFSAFASLWTFNNFYLRLNQQVESLRISYGLGIVVAFLCLVWICTFLKSKIPKIINYVFFPISASLFLLTIFSDKVIESLYRLTHLGYEGKLGIFFPFYSSFFAVVIFYAFYLLINSYREANKQEEKSQIKSIILGISFFSITSFIVSFLIPTIFHTLSFTMLDNFSFSVFLIVITYTILRFHLFSIKVIATELLTFCMWLLMLIRAITSNSIKDHIINWAGLAVAVILGVFLIRSVLQEVKTREKIQKMADDLAHANERLTELDKLKSEFVSLATHQIRGPLAAIKGYASLILEGDYGVVPRGLEKPIETVFESSKSLAVIVDDFLNVSRIEQGKMKYDYTVFDLCALVNESCSELKPTVIKKGLELHVAVCEEPVMVRADMGKIKQVINNVMDNSIKYTPEGHIKISIQSNKDERKVVIRVSDTGVGIRAETIPYLFKKFSRAEDASKVNILGTGLGLYVAKEMIEAQGGKIWVESQGEGKGSDFYIELKMA